VSDAVTIGFERTLRHDPSFGMRQLVDIALQSLASGIKDPYTVVQALHGLAALLCQLVRYPLGQEIVQDRDGGARVVLAAPSFAAYLDLACGQIRRAGAGEPTVAAALLALLGTVGTVLTEQDPRRAVLAQQVQLVLTDAERRAPQPADLAGVQTQATQVLTELTRHASNSGPALRHRPE
jgi:uncharacterized membrane protein